MTTKLEAGFRRAAALTKAHGTTYYWGARMLPAAQRRDVESVYALCRLADDIVDEPDRRYPGVPIKGAPGERLRAFRDIFFTGLDIGDAADPTMAAAIDTVTRRGIDRDCFDRFFGAMALDVHPQTWVDWPDLRDRYMEGSAAVIGEMMLPVLEPTDQAAALKPARALGLAFQLTNFLRDVGEDLDRGRVYLPQNELEATGADPRLRRVTPQWREFMSIQILRNRELYDEAATGLDALLRASRKCVATALVLYSRILDRIEQADYDVFAGRIRVPNSEKFGLFVRAEVFGAPPVLPLAHADGMAQ